MRRVNVGVFDAAGRMRNPTETAIYCVAAELPGSAGFVVKIGMSDVPFERYSTLLSGIPFPSAMKWSWAGSRVVARRIELALHRRFAPRQTAREWFLFSKEEAPSLWGGVAAEFEKYAQAAPAWNRITEAQAAAFRTESRAPLRKEARRT